MNRNYEMLDFVSRFGGKIKVAFRLAKYTSNKRLFVGILADEDGFLEPWTDLTVNMPDTELSDENCVFIDTNNNGSDIVFWLMENGLGNPTARWAYSGFCSYPEFRLDFDRLEQFVASDNR